MTVIIGAGAAGLMAALAAVRQGKTVEVYEKMDSPGIKLALAGGGRCNLSNTGNLLNGLHEVRFLRPALTNLDNQGLRNILRDIGVDTMADQYARVYPKDMTGKELAEYVHTWLVRQGVNFHFASPLTGLDIENGALTGIEIRQKAIPCSRVIIACGGNTWPQTGSDGTAAGILETAGHTITPLLPALAPIKTREDWPTQLKGISLETVSISVLGAGKKIDQTRGSLLFTHFGLSGPAVLDVSHAAARALHEKKPAHIVLDLLPDMSWEEIRAKLEQQRDRTLANALSSLFPGKLAKSLGNEQYIKGLASPTLEKFARGLKEVRLEVVDVLGKNHAMVCQGGVSLREVNPRTMESRQIQGLFIAGEILDYHGRTGGYNLHAAFASGWLAGENA